MRRSALFTAITAGCLLAGVTVGASPAPADDGEAQRVLISVAEPGDVDDVAHLADWLGAEVTAEVPASGAVAAEATPQQIEALEASADVVSVVPDRPLQVALDESVPLIGANTTRAANHRGGGRVVVVIDTGVQSDHEFFEGRVVDGACFSAGSDCPNGETSQEGIDGGEPCDFSSDCFHGTHVAGIIAGANDDFTGVAPDASILSINVATASNSNCGGDPCLEIWTSDMLSALEQALEWSDTYEIASVNMSIGGGLFSGSNCDSYELSSGLKPVIGDLRDAGVATVIAAGNEYSTTKTAFPACISNAVAVGATTKSNVVASYSNSSVAVDMWAPGSAITSAAPTSIYSGGYVTASGTSMATPHVAGAFAVVDELLPTATLSAKQTRIVSTGPTITDARNKLKRHRLKLSTDITPPQTKLTSGPGSTVKSSKVSFKFTTGVSGATYSCQVDNGAWKSCSAPKSATVSKGSHTFRVRGRDAAGNLDASPATKTWRYA